MKKNFKAGDVIFRKYIIDSIDDDSIIHGEVYEDYPVNIGTDNANTSDNVDRYGTITLDGKHSDIDKFQEYFTEEEVFEMLKPKKELTIAQRLGIKKFPFNFKDENDNIIYYESSLGIWSERTYNENGKTLTYKNSDGYWEERTYDEKSNQLTYKDSNGFWEECTYDENGNTLTYKNSNGIFRDFRPKQVELTLDEIANKFGVDVNQLKIKK